MNTSTLTNLELDSLLDDFVGNSVLVSNPPLYAVYKTLFDHGFRIRELKSIETWIHQPNEIVICKTLKGSNDRLIPANELNYLILESIDAGTNLVWNTSYSTIERFFDRNKGVLQFLVNDAPISTHLFRHNRVKQLYESGLNTAQVKAVMGILSDDVTENYRDSVIKKVTL